jgi:hypothetical protein
LGFAIVSLTLGWYTVNARQYAAEMEAVQNLNVGKFGYVAALREGQLLGCGTGVCGVARLRWQGPEWLRKPLESCGLPILYRVEDLGVAGDGFSDAMIPQLAVFRSLERIELNDSKITWEGRQRVAAMFPMADIRWQPPAEATADPNDPFRVSATQVPLRRLVPSNQMND